MKKILCYLYLFISPLCIYAQQTHPLSAAQLLQKWSDKYQIYFAYPTSVLEDIKLNYQESSFKSFREEFNHYFLKEGIEMAVVDQGHVLLRKSNTLLTSSNISISGQLVDDVTGQYISGASVYLNDFTRSTISDSLGKWTIHVNEHEKEKNIIVSFLGFSEISIPIHQNKNLGILRLKEKHEELPTVEISFIRPGVLLDMDKNAYIGYINADEMNYTFDGSAFDLPKTIQLLPGISAQSEHESGIKVRGSNSDETLIILDEMPIFNKSHYNGFFSSFNSMYLHGFELYKNILPTEYQGGNSGMIKLYSLQNIQNDEIHINLNSFTLAGGLNKKLGSNAGISIAARTTYGDFNKRVNTGDERLEDFNSKLKLVVLNPQYSFYDLNGKYFTRINKKLRMDLNAFKSFDKVSGTQERDVFDKPGKGRGMRSDSQDKKVDSYAMSVNMSYLLSNASQLKFNTFLSNYSSKYDEKSAFSKTTMEHAGNLELTSKEDLKVIGMKAYMNREVPQGFNKYGIEINRFSAEQMHDINDVDLFKKTTTALLTNAFCSYAIKLKRVSFEPSLRASVYQSNNKSNLRYSPQFIASFRPTSAQQVKASIGLNYQFLRDIEYENPFGRSIYIKTIADNSSVPIGRSLNEMLGYSINFSNFSLDIEAWYKQREGVLTLLPTLPVINNQHSEPGEIRYDLISGKGRAKGIDVLLSYNEKNFTTWLSYTISKTMEKFTELYGDNWFNSPNDRRHQLKFSNRIKLGKVDLSTNYIYASGRPYLALENLPETFRNDFQNLAFISNLPSYQRLDFNAMYNFSIAKKRTALGFSIFNLLDHTNIDYIQYNYKLMPKPGEPDFGLENFTIGSTSELLRRSFSFNFNIWF